MHAPRRQPSLQNCLLKSLLISSVLLIGAAVQGQTLNSLQQTARRCFQGSDRPSCRSAMELSVQLREQADSKNALRCYTALLGVEAMLNLSLFGDRDQARDEQALLQSSQECQALQIRS